MSYTLLNKEFSEDEVGKLSESERRSSLD